jgi:hypothetical protein
MDERALIGEQNEAGGVFIEAADARDDGIAALPARWEQAVNVGSFAEFVGADEAEGFVEEENDAVRMIEGFALDEDIGGVGFLRRAVGRLATDDDRAGIDPVAGFATGAVTQVCEELVEAAHDSKCWGAASARGMLKTIRVVTRQKRLGNDGG